MTCIFEDDDADIEAEIQRELDELELSSLQIEDDVKDDNLTSNINEVILKLLNRIGLNYVGIKCKVYIFSCHKQKK